MNIDVQQVAIEQLIPYTQNARTHSEEQVLQIANSIAEFGFVNPILLGKDDVIIAGHGRLLAARTLELRTVPIIRLEHLTELQQRALLIADNKIAENATWDEELLKAELQNLLDNDFNTNLLGFSDQELDELMHKVEDNEQEIIEKIVPTPEMQLSRKI
jgi:ParB-like chromosome segregation protein Spo0J